MDNREWGVWGGITWGEIPDVGDGGMEAANHVAMCVPIQQSCMICTCTPEPKVQLKKKKNIKVLVCEYHDYAYVRPHLSILK